MSIRKTCYDCGVKNPENLMLVANNRRSDTRKRNVLKCRECSGHNELHRKEVAKNIAKGTKEVRKAQEGGPQFVSDKCLALLEELKGLQGKASWNESSDLLTMITIELNKNSDNSIDEETWQSEGLKNYEAVRDYDR